jgi:hypothetical protein
MEKMTRGTCVFSIVAVMAAGGCLEGEWAAEGGETEDVSSTKQALVVQTRMSITIPAALDFQRVAASASGLLLVGDRAQIVTTTAGLYADSASTGTVRAHYGYDAKVGSITAAGAVRVMDRGQVTGSIASGGDIRFGTNELTDPAPANVTVTGSITRNTLVPVQTLAWMVPYDTSTNNPTYGSGSNSLAPGSYGSVNVQGGTLNLRAGTYYIDRLTLEPNAIVNVNTTSGPVYIYVRTAFLHKGTWTASAEKVFLGYFGTQLLALERTFAGTVVAPNARVRFAVGSTPHSGSVFAKEVEFDPNVRYTFRPFSRWDQINADPTVDADCDGASDQQETAAGLSPTNPDDGSTDPDGDGIPSDEELILGGNPRAADSDGDGIGDATDLIAPTDLDGDGRHYSSDNCPDDGNPGQQDADGDGKGDACDPTPVDTEETALTRLALYRSTSGDAALAPPGIFDTHRARTDLKGLFQTEVTVLGFESPLGSMHRVDEMWHPSGAHAYAISTSEKNALASQGYEEIGQLGYFPVNAPTLGVPVQIRRFAKSISGRTSHAVAVTESGASALVAEGFAEIAPIGYGLQDQGAVVKSSIVVRYRDASNHYRYGLSALSETNITGWTSTGRHFRLLAQPNTWAIPLHRLVKADGTEALALTSEIAGFQSQGFVRRGILGYAYPASGHVQAIEHTRVLQRVSGAGREAVYTSNPSEVQSLLASGYTTATPIARVIGLRGLDRYRNGGSCLGEKPLVDRIRSTSVSANPLAIAGRTAFTLATACTIKRVTGTGPITAAEEAVRSRFALVDPLIVQTAKTQAERILAMTAAQRASLLGPLSTLDPGACTGPIDWKRVGSGVVQALQGSGTLPGGINGGTTGGTMPQSLVKLRAPQCSGVTYAPGDRATATEAARAVTATNIGEKPPCYFEAEIEYCPAAPVYDVNPRVFGVVRGARGLPTGGAVDQWTNEHTDVGAPLSGIFKSDGCSACSATLGEACVEVPGSAAQCRSYPVVNNNTTLRLTGMNFWDLKTARLRLTRVSDGRVIEGDMTGMNVRQIVSNAELPARCDADPVVQGSLIGTSGGLPAEPTCTPTPAAPICIPKFTRGVGENEDFIEEMEVFISVPDTDVNEFYTVQVVNFNGSYVPRGEQVPFDLQHLAAQGRSVHVCQLPGCNPAPHDTNAACSLVGMPACGGAVRGTWNAPPRSLSECTALRNASGDPSFQCAETPFTFVSSPVARDGTPLRVYVAGDQSRFIQTRLSKVHCNDETGWDAMGKDELVVGFGGIAIPELAVGDLEVTGDVYRTSINSGNSRFPEKKFRGVRSDLTETGPSGFVFGAGEDDDIGAMMVGVTVIAAASGGFASALTGGGALAIAAAAGGGGLGGFVTSYAGSDRPWLDPDDFIGRDAWTTTSNEVALRGVLSHAPPLETVPLLTPSQDDRRHVRYRDAGKHASVDGRGYNSNADVRECVAATQCTTARPLCAAGACVQSTWTDKTFPIPFDATTDAPGTMEHLRLDGDADYEFWLSTSVSGKL